MDVGDRVDAVNTDNGANFAAAIEILLELGRIEEVLRCVCHTLQLSIKTALEVSPAWYFLDYIDRANILSA